jgi:apolipoprotein D and lipocalin family protein
MKPKLKTLLSALCIGVGCIACNQDAKVATVSTIDLMRYSGTWYEIAAYPQYFEKGCSNVKATYTPKNDYIEVFNQSMKNGDVSNIKGKAFVVPKSGDAKLKVQFFWPFKADYWIIDIAPDYSWAIVSNPKMTTLWILARTAVMKDVLYNQLVESLVKKGFDRNKIVKMVQIH